MDPEVLLEALSVLTGSEVKPDPDPDSGGLDVAELTVHNFVSSALLPLVLCKDEPESEPEVSSDPANVQRVNMEKFLNPKYNYDFRALRAADAETCSRGGEPYTRPRGWFRFALQVLDQYPDGNTWLGSGGWRSESAPGEWPVSYHGTGREGAEPGNERHAQDEYGIYSTPDITMAEQNPSMHKEFTSSKTGKNYSVMMQNRINPNERIKKSDKIWLIKIPVELYGLDEEKRKQEMRKIVEKSIRPYGILLKENN